ncbi:pentatricopeptide repeat-containing protein At4g14190, chloroplastic-like isoform X2 [Durio zibethinus]|uniref:Pentatricopeptide repeat-containing protein At4g14190, chloroplastic-like isoform X2 n=1 Tax=Durio zibethinus TaxID=66656 RepID=A0A6P5X494_DURZI|nr:pentatricopeptide repeat-containing protein At4g14190, chloroplastic-like isoform X2 [Durio zibethinus]
MENAVTLNLECKITFRWQSSIYKNNQIFIFSGTQFPKATNHCCLSSIRPSPPASIGSSSKTHTTLLVETYHHHRRLKGLLERLEKEDSCPLQILGDDGDWTKDTFWAVIRFLRHASRSNEILQVFHMWKNIEKSRISELNYEKIIRLLGEEGMIEEAVEALREMEGYGLQPSLEIYNSIIHAYAMNGKFDDALFFLNEMKEIGLAPETDTYDGLIEAYGKYKMYDEIGACLKTMELDRCPPDHFTYNLLIREFSRGGLLQKMERIHQIVLSKQMNLQSSSLVAMLEAYANFGILDKMEKVYRKVVNLTTLKEDTIRKLANVYIKNYMFSRLDDLGIDLSSRTGRNDFVWCLRLLSHACLLSRKGMDSIIQEMDEAKASWNVTIANIILLAYMKMKDFNRLRNLLSQLPSHQVRPDITTFGILFDAIKIGFDGAEALKTWRRMGLLYRAVEMNTDPLVLIAFGKGHFLRDCEEGTQVMQTLHTFRKL